ncbi:MAG: hypothetical protein IPK88_12840 [Saprospiraceae bacterium]|nr:hypothetical protein [Candidatus Defluviibacterium haderslevense]
MPSESIKQRFCIIKIIEASPTQLAFVRVCLNELFNIEIDNLFVVSCLKSFKNTLDIKLKAEGIKYILVYINHKTGADVLVNGINNPDTISLEKIILDT